MYCCNGQFYLTQLFRAMIKHGLAQGWVGLKSRWVFKFHSVSPLAPSAHRLQPERFKFSSLWLRQPLEPSCSFIRYNLALWHSKHKEWMRFKAEHWITFVCSLTGTEDTWAQEQRDTRTHTARTKSFLRCTQRPGAARTRLGREHKCSWTTR